MEIFISMNISKHMWVCMYLHTVLLDDILRVGFIVHKT